MKPGSSARTDGYIPCFDRTYEELKRLLRPLGSTLRAGFDRTYEELKQRSAGFPAVSAFASFDRTYEELKLDGLQPGDKRLVAF